jgi:hypothetical protein
MKYQNILKTAFLLTILAVATSCSRSATEPLANLSSSTNPSDPGTASQVGLLADCNQKSQGGVTANLMTYTDPTTKKIRDDYMKLKFIQVPLSFSQGSYFEFFRGKADAAGQPFLDSVPTKARFETLDGRALTEFSAVIYWGQVASVAASMALSDPNAFFKNVRLVIDIRDVNMEYDTLKIALYSSSNQLLNDMDMLLPPFYVNPAEYAKDGTAPRAPFLMALHPYAYTTEASSEQLLAAAKAYCF